MPTRSLPHAPWRYRSLGVALTLFLSAPAFVHAQDTTTPLIEGVAPATMKDSYRGSVVTNELPDQKIPLRLSIFERTDSTTVGWLEAGEPLNVRGLTWVNESSGDSLFMVTEASSGDTIVWASDTRAGSIGGDYWISGGPNVSKGGTWRLDVAPRLSEATLTLIVYLLAGIALFGIHLTARALAPRFWDWRHRQPLTVTDSERVKLHGVGGWLLWLVIAQSLVVVTLVIRYGEVGEGLGDGWMLGVAVTGMRPMLLIESAFHVIQLFAIIGGIVLILRKSTIAPVYWISYLTLIVAYAVFDVSATIGLREDMAAVFGADGLGDFGKEAAAANRLNSRMGFWAFVWLLYWLKSRRVVLTLSPRRGSLVMPTAPPRGVAVPAGFSVAPSNEKADQVSQ